MTTYRISRKKLLQNTINGIREQFEIINSPNFKCDGFHKTYCSMLTSLLDINQTQLGSDCSEKKCIFKDAKVVVY